LLNGELDRHLMSRRLHVLFLTAHDGLGADVAVHLCLARALDREKVRVSAATSLPIVAGTSAAEAFAAVPEITHLALDLGQTVGTRRGLQRALAKVSNARAVLNLVRVALWCRREGVDVIHVTDRPRQALFGLFVARLSGAACVIQAHVSHYPHDATLVANARLKLADALVGVSHFTAATYERNGKLRPERVYAVHNAIDTEAFRPDVADAARAEMRRHLGLPLDARVIGCVARLMRWKGQDRLLDAFALVRAKIPNAHLILAGETLDLAPHGAGDYRDYLLRRAAALGLANAVHLPGFIPASTMPHFYGALDLLAHPSSEEPFGLVVVEAMASGRPVIASDRGGTPEIIRDGTDGLLVPVDSPQAVASAITRVLSDATLSRRLSTSGRHRVLENFTPRVQADAMLRVYEEVVSRRRSTAASGTSPLQRRTSYG
jgi:glycosyltransferase involved in cell wall biosynthesis